MPYTQPPNSLACRWRSGPPPSIGWWPASFHKDPWLIRWWDGKCWSYGIESSQTAGAAATQARLKRSAGDTARIFWTDRWWPNKD